MKSILHSKPWITEADLAVLADVLYSGMLAQGEKTRAFEHALSNWIGSEYDGVAVGSGAAALALALSALAVGVSDEVVLPTYVCTSVLETVYTTGATPVLCDVGCNWVVTAENMAKCITQNTKALIVPHMYGIFADVEAFRQFGIPIVEDCAQAIDYQGKRKICGDIAVFSFHPTKCFTTGEGGMAVTAKPDLLDIMRTLRDGSEKSATERFFSPMSDISASLGLSQLSRYHAILDRRKEMAYGYKLALEKVIPHTLQDVPFERSMFFRFPLKISGGIDAYQELFIKKNIHVRQGVDKLLHRLMGLSDEKFKMSVTLFNTTVSLPIYPALTDAEYTHCVKSAVEIFSREV